MKYFAQSQKEFIYKYVVMFSDTDQFRHMSFANYAKLMYLAADAFLLSHKQENGEPYFFRNISSSMQFKRQTTIGQHILIKINSSNIEGLGFSLLFTFSIEDTGDLVVLAKQNNQIVNERGDLMDFFPDEIKRGLEMIQVNEENLLYSY